MAKETESGLCFVCCNSVSQCTSSNEGSKSTLSYEIYFEFFSFAERYLQFNASDWCYDSKLEVFCEPCLERLKGICELYEELCVAELQLSSKLRELGKLLGKPQGNVFVEEEQTETTTSVEEADAVEGIRNFLALKCLKKVENVKIKRTEEESSEEPLLESRNDEDHDDDDDEKLEVEEYHKEELFDSEEEVEMEVGIPTSPLRTESIKSEDNSCSETEESIFEPGSEDGLFSEAESSSVEEEASIEEDEKGILQKRPRRKQKIEQSMIHTNIIRDNNFLVCDQCDRICINSKSLYMHLLSHEKQTAEQKTPCCFCANSFFSKQMQLLHMELRHPLEFATEKPFKCDEKDCEISFETVPELNKHLAKHSKPIDFCSVCQWGFVNSEYYKLHELLHTPANRGYPCPSCKVKAKNLMELQVHYDRLHGARLGLGTFKCPECEKVFSTRLGFENHMRKLGNSDEHEDEEKRYKCCYCGARYSDKEARIKHISKECNKNPDNNNINIDNIIHTTDRNGKLVKGIQCKHCGKFVRKERIKGHLTTHLEERERARVICDICGVSFSSDSTLNSHMDFVHKGIKRKRFECQDCGKSFGQNFLLNDHMDKVHKGIDISVICEVCGIVLSSQSNYKIHRKKMHLRLEQKPHACHLCHRRYRGREGLKKHLVSFHGKTKGEEFTPGECLVLKSICMFPSCDTKFATSVELQSHVEQNHAPAGEKEFMCNLCGKMLANQARLTRHNLVHTQEKPHACHLCSKAFNHKASLKDHLKSAHDMGNEQFACEQPNCKSKFKIRKYLWKHLRDVHGLTPTK